MDDLSNQFILSGTDYIDFVGLALWASDKRASHMFVPLTDLLTGWWPCFFSPFEHPDWISI